MSEAWFEKKICDTGCIISSKCRLARNIDGYNFSPKLDEESARRMIDKTVEQIRRDPKLGGSRFYDFRNMNLTQKQEMQEQHSISNYLVGQKEAAGFISEDRSVSLMVNEEDHIRIQTFSAGAHLDAAFEEANRLDDELGRILPYVYSDKYGYLTPCLSSTGTGMRASYFLHLPVLALAGQIESVKTEISRFNVALKPVTGEGRKSPADVYQITNTMTLGVREEDVISSLQKITAQIVAQEQAYEKQYFTQQRDHAIDAVWRCYATLKYARMLSYSDALVMLSQIRLGLNAGIIRPAADTDGSIYALMIRIQPASLQTYFGKEMIGDELEKARALYLRTNLPDMVDAVSAQKQ